MSRKTTLQWLVAISAALLISGCQKSMYVMHINDVYRINGVEEGERGSFARLRTLRSELEAEHPMMLLHGGDFLFPSIESRITDGAHMIRVMNLLDGSDLADDRLVVTLGNHEFDKDDADEAHILQARIDESDFDWLNGNVVWKVREGQPLIAAENLKPYVTRHIGGLKVGIFGLTINSRIPAYAETIDADYVDVARRASRHLRESGHDVVIGLTHLRMSDDVRVLLETGDDGPDIIFGGHEHAKQCSAVGNRLVIKADADARTAVVAKIAVGLFGQVSTTFAYQSLGPEVKRDEAMLAELEVIGETFDSEFCTDQKLAPGCLNQRLGKTNVALEGEELKIRGFETNLGNFIADKAMIAYPGSQIAFINSGAIRLNQDIKKDSVLYERHLREIFQYPGALYQIEMTGLMLQQVIEHAVEDWPGNGWWLQIAGFRYTHRPDSSDNKAINLQIFDDGGYRDVLPTEKILAVTNGYLLAHPYPSDQDGYWMLSADQIVLPTAGDKAATLIDQTRSAIQSASVGVNAELEERIKCVGASCAEHEGSNCSAFETLVL